MHWLLLISSLLVGTAAALKALHVIYVRALRPLGRAMRRMFWAVGETITVGKVVKDMASQFRNNGGSTLRDAVDKLSKRLDAQDEMLGGIARTQANILEAVTKPK